MNLLKNIKNHFIKHCKKLSTTVIVFDENTEKQIEYQKDLPKNVLVKGKDKSNLVRLHKNLLARNVVISFGANTKNCKCTLDDSGDSAGLDINAIFLAGENSELSIGKRTGMNGTKIWLGNGSKCHIGDDCRFSYEIIIRTTDGHTILDNATNEVVNHQKQPCVIGDRCWIGLRTIINKNVQLANDTIVGSGSVLVKSYTEPYTAIAGNPAKIIKQGIRHDRRTIYNYELDTKAQKAKSHVDVEIE